MTPDHDDKLSGIKDLLFKKWSMEGTFVVRSEGDKLIITIGTERGIYAMIKMPVVVVDLWSSMARKLLEGQVFDNEK